MSDSENITEEDLGRWLADDMTPEELAIFEQTDAYHTYKIIASYSEKIEVPAYHVEGEYKRLKKRIDKRKIKVVRLRAMVAIAAVTIAIVAISSLLFMESEVVPTLVVVNTNVGQNDKIVLPDNSTIDLNIASSIEYDKDNWSDNRIIHLDGEAYFDVTKGSKFEVRTTIGNIQVLGTEFNVRMRRNILEVDCYEGRVLVSDTIEGTVELEVNQRARVVNGRLVKEIRELNTDEPKWQFGESEFVEIPLGNVLEELKNQFGVEISGGEKIEHRLYTGGFPHDNLKDAIELVLLPMSVKFTIKGDSVIVIM